MTKALGSLCTSSKTLFVFEGARRAIWDQLWFRSSSHARLPLHTHLHSLHHWTLTKVLRLECVCVVKCASFATDFARRTLSLFLHSVRLLDSFSAYSPHCLVPVSNVSHSNGRRTRPDCKSLSNTDSLVITELYTECTRRRIPASSSPTRYKFRLRTTTVPSIARRDTG